MKIVGFNQYQQLTARTDASLSLSPEMRLMNVALGLNGEGAEMSELITAIDPRHQQLAGALMQAAGRVAEYTKKTVFHQHPSFEETKAKVGKELGDILWYLARAADAIGMKLEDIATANIEKLQKRYPAGFTPEDSAAKRDEAA
jgi:NTP pyrophosphatase (non-canonical NTP hydrolase)